MKVLKMELDTYCELHWWNMGRKTISFKGTLKDLLKKQGISYTKRKTDTEGIYNFYFKSEYGIKYNVKSTLNEFSYHAKHIIQMELVRMGDKSQLYVSGCWRPMVTVNF